MHYVQSHIGVCALLEVHNVLVRCTKCSLILVCVHCCVVLCAVPVVVVVEAYIRARTL